MTMGRRRSLFFRQLALLLAQGVPLLRALEVLGNQMQTRDPLAPVVAELLSQLQQGQRLSRCLQRHPQAFPALAWALVQVGEETGGLVNVLERLALWLERSEELRANTWKALTYPLFVLAVVGILLLLLLWGVVPSFATILQELNTPLPWPTRWLLQAAAWLRHPLGGAAAVFTLLACSWTIQQYVRTPAGWRQTLSWGKRIPLAGRLLQLDGLVRYADVMSLGLDCGLDYVKTLRLAAEVSGDPAIQDDAPALVEAVRDGEGAGDTMHAFPQIYPVALSNLLRSGEESGLVAHFMRVARSTFELELEIARKSLFAAFEPLLMVLVGALVGGVVLALLWPLQASLTQLLGA